MGISLPVTNVDYFFGTGKLGCSSTPIAYDPPHVTIPGRFLLTSFHFRAVDALHGNYSTGRVKAAFSPTAPGDCHTAFSLLWTPHSASPKKSLFQK